MSEPPDFVGSETEAAHSTELLTAGQLPAQAQDRLARMRRDRSYTSALTTAEFAAIRSVGFEPVGQVLGTSVYQIGWAGTQACGAWRYRYGSGFRTAGYGPPGYGGPGVGPMGGGLGRVVGRGIGINMPGGFAGPIGMGPAYGGFGSGVATPLEQALRDARQLATGRAMQECQALGGDGVVGVRLTFAPFPGTNALEFQAIGTAVRGLTKNRPREPFMSDLSGQDFAKLLLAGWVPCGFAFGIAAVARHDDWMTRQASSRLNAQNVEVPGFTALVEETRQRARKSLENEVGRHGGEGVVVSSMELRTGEQECMAVEGGRDHVAEAVTFGTVVASFRRRPDTAPVGGTLPILRLSDRHRRVIKQGSRL